MTNPAQAFEALAVQQRPKSRNVQSRVSAIEYEKFEKFIEGVNTRTGSKLTISQATRLAILALIGEEETTKA